MSASQLISLLLVLVESLQRSLLSGALDSDTPIEISHLGDDFRQAVEEMRKSLEG